MWFRIIRKILVIRDQISNWYNFAFNGIIVDRLEAPGLSSPGSSKIPGATVLSYLISTPRLSSSAYIIVVDSSFMRKLTSVMFLIRHTSAIWNRFVCLLFETFLDWCQAFCWGTIWHIWTRVNEHVYFAVLHPCSSVFCHVLRCMFLQYVSRTPSLHVIGCLWGNWFHVPTLLESLALYLLCQVFLLDNCWSSKIAGCTACLRIFFV